jgi:hypothetical protein
MCCSFLVCATSRKRGRTFLAKAVQSAEKPILTDLTVDSTGPPVTSTEPNGA